MLGPYRSPLDTRFDRFFDNVYEGEGSFSWFQNKVKPGVKIVQVHHTLRKKLRWLKVQGLQELFNQRKGSA